MRTALREAAVGLFFVWHKLSWRAHGKLALWWQSARARALFESVGTEVRCYGRVHRLGTGRVRLGQHGNLHEDVLLETRGPGRIEIAEGFVLNRGALVSAHDCVRLGRNVLVGEFTSIRDHDHAHDAGSRRGAHVTRPVVVEDDVWIGRGCAVLKGVTIGRGAIVGANSVVTRDVAAGAVVAGAPARPIAARGKA